MKDNTLVFLYKPEEKQILLAMKKRGFGEGKWNGVGGKVAEGETVEDAAVREAEEEIGVSISTENLKPVALLRFEFDDNPNLVLLVHTFFVEVWSGEPKESEEMRPQWYGVDDIPYKEMWVDDIEWLPRVLAGECLSGRFLFTKGGAEIAELELTPL